MYAQSIYVRTLILITHSLAPYQTIITKCLTLNLNLTLTPDLILSVP